MREIYLTTVVNMSGKDQDKVAMSELFEVFVRSSNGLEHRHVGSLHAYDAEMALHHARDVYVRRSEGVSIWVVPSRCITASDPDRASSLFEPMSDKDFRYPTYYHLPERVKNL
jgi:ring-1,2-phenylacetyl-CoA epoxidase subunit PaaB